MTDAKITMVEDEPVQPYDTITLETVQRVELELPEVKTMLRKVGDKRATVPLGSLSEEHLRDLCEALSDRYFVAWEAEQG